jgi:phage baseplate assembly protein W
MPDLYHEWGQDLVPTSSGDFQTVDGVTLGTQRVLRRLLTNPGDYIFHPTYGAGLPARVGTLLDTPGLTALIRSQMFQEACVATTPLPTVNITQIADGSGSISVDITYTDAQSGQQASLSFDLSS